MIWLILAGIFALLVGVLCFISDYGPGETISLFFGSAFVGLVVAVALNIIVGAFISGENNIDRSVTKTSALVAIQDNYSGIQGSFFLGTGSISNTPTYVYVKETDNGISIESIPSSKAYLKFDNENPRIETYVGRFKSPISRWFGFNWSAVYYVIYIPEGSLLTNYNIDLVG